MEEAQIVQENEKYVNLAIQTARYIDSKKVETENGIKWLLNSAYNGSATDYYSETCFYAGSAGIIHYYIQLADVLGDNNYLESAEQGASELAHQWREQESLNKNFSRWAFTTGYIGVAYAFLELYEVTKKSIYAELVTEIVEQCIQEATPAELGYYWSGSIGIVADSGTILFLLKAAKHLNRSDWKEFAIQAGYFIVGKSKKREEGKYYIGLNERAHTILPGFPMGTSGIGFTLLRLYEESKDEIFLKETEGIKEFYDNVATECGHGIVTPHDVPNNNLHYLGYCHGAVGTARYFYHYDKLLNDKEHKEYYLKLVEGVIEAGAPEIHSEGYWNTYNFCCGTAGMLNLFLGTWADTKDEKYLEYARRAAEHLVNRAYHFYKDGELQVKWIQAYDRMKPEDISAAIGYYDGAAGIASTLLQYHLAINGQYRVSRAIDDPFPVR